jgi:hypothetical protein
MMWRRYLRPLLLLRFSMTHRDHLIPRVRDTALGVDLDWVEDDRPLKEEASSCTSRI